MKTDEAALVVDALPSAMQVLRRYFREAASPDLSVPQFRVLAHVSRGNETAAELAERQGVSSAAISKMVAELVERGLLERTFREGNRKQVFLRLSDEGRVTYQRVRKAAQRRVARRLEAAAPATRASIRAGLAALQSIFSEE